MKTRHTHSTQSDHHLLIPPGTNATLPIGVFFDEDFWIANTRRFSAFAERRIRRYSWRGTFGGRPPGDKEASDYVAEAAALLMSGQRHANALQSRERAVYRAIASLVWHDYERLENQIRHRNLAMTAPDVGDHGDDDVDESVLSADVPDIDEMIAAREYLEKYKSNFPEGASRRYLDLLADGYVPAVEAAVELDLLESEIWGIRKALKRSRTKWPGRPPRV
jgi:hypothetical protein